ncbi:DUF262 domain-containing protein [Bacillus toyonensis]|uniref:DUF262 domain-containing protein n=1 Tax=Bacillus toyonensis TaxID=155322 RepID=UPI00124BED80|nr:DUF262 domain-containing protein [Bacillus toyonensis]KAB2357037.1 DUF262 domain-containing protein [Bacillus toyonensis]
MLLENEYLDFKVKEHFNGKSDDDDAINEKYQTGEMRILTEQGRYPLQSIKEILSKNMEFNPEYQRRRVWSNIQKSRLIESFIMNIPVPPVFLYEIEFSKHEIMDGLQRLSTLNDFYFDKFELEGLEVWEELNGRTYSQLPENIKAGIDRRYISTIVILNETAKNKEEEQLLKKYVFERLNTGGTKLTDQENRNALYDGKMNTLCLKISNENEIFKKIWNIPMVHEEELLENSLYKRMEDVELILRFFAYRQIETIPAIRLKEILDLYLIEANSRYSDEILENLEEVFSNTINLAYSIFAERSFLLYSKRKNGEYQWYNSPSKLVYDPIMKSLSKYSHDEEKKERLIFAKEEISNKIEELFKTHGDDFNGRNNNKSDVLRRTELFNTIWEGY